MRIPQMFLSYLAPLMCIASLITSCACPTSGLVCAGQPSSPSTDVLSLAPGASPTPPASGGIGTSSSGLWAGDPNLAAPTIISANATDNAIVLTWSDGTNSLQTGYVICFYSCSEIYSVRINDRTAQAAWYLEIPSLPNPPVPNTSLVLVPGNTYDVSVAEASANGIGGLATRSVSLTAPRIRVGDPSTGGVFTPQAARAFAVWDANNDGIVNDAQGSGGLFPLFQSAIGLDPVVQAGNQFGAAGAVRANIVVGYFFYANSSPQFVALHFFINPNNQVTPVSVLYGDAQPGVRGSFVWFGLAAASNIQVVTEGNATLHTPNIIQGTVTSTPMLAANGTHRVVDFSFNLALQEE
jgi:hypothetical protein